MECLRIALEYNVTDIHFNLANQDHLEVEMRVNGVIRKLRKQYDISFFRYLLYKANLDVSDTYMPQTGRFEVSIDGYTLSLRLALVSSLYMTSCVLRILNNHQVLSVKMLSRDPEQIRWFSNIQNHRNGLIVFSGPTGSGKTTTLYTILNEIQGKKIFTLEDPVEIYFERYVQLQVNDKMNLSYADGIKQLMRHDPDIVMVGEIRDSEAAEMAVRCALTGHLVVTTIHSSSSAQAIHRLNELGVSLLQLQDVLTGIVNQRLYNIAEDNRLCIYEIMDKKEIGYYFRNNRNSESFVSLSRQIQNAVDEGILPASLASQDLAG